MLNPDLCAIHVYCTKEVDVKEDRSQSNRLKEEMWKKDIKKAAMLAVGLGGALALYNSRQKINYLTQTFLYLDF